MEVREQVYYTPRYDWVVMLRYDNLRNYSAVCSMSNFCIRLRKLRVLGRQKWDVCIKWANLHFAYFNENLKNYIRLNSYKILGKGSKGAKRQNCVNLRHSTSFDHEVCKNEISFNLGIKGKIGKIRLPLPFSGKVP
jgi:hypothetical protein